MLQDSVRIKNRLRAVFRARGIQAPAEEISSASTRTGWSATLPPAVRRRAMMLGEELDAMLELRDNAKE